MALALTMEEQASTMMMTEQEKRKQKLPFPRRRIYYILYHQGQDAFVIGLSGTGLGKFGTRLSKYLCVIGLWVTKWKAYCYELNYNIAFSSSFHSLRCCCPAFA